MRFLKTKLFNELAAETMSKQNHFEVELAKQFSSKKTSKKHLQISYRAFPNVSHVLNELFVYTLDFCC